MRVFTNGKFLLTTMFLSVVVTIYVFGYHGGITGRTQKNGVGCTCHANSPSSAVSVIIDGPASLLPGQTETYTVTISGGPLVAGGTNIAASAGTLAPGTGLRLENSELTHQAPKTSSSGNVAFSFTYTAPATEGPVTLFANGNSVNLDGTNSNDQWNFAQNKTISVSSATDIKSEKYNLSYDLKQNYPNPFNPTTTIFYQIPKAGNVVLKVYNITGTEVTSLVNGYKQSGSYSVEFDASSLSSGVYFYKISVNNFSEIKKMVLLR
ncbi:MAG: T9SS type A sorting domain-containing protein [Ignavibacteria bacterium]|nr:T9SS type A sorting domain-containing protein [Ignavibacteria bacterium]OIO19359.1 MAG: hypothetical protein AUJ54_06675 [Ignavibacteria bacterium CG1_02_37_35]PIS46375.1 MAG: hypothetical protein COT22_00330 [Ignavibacteria bacterium CG08_land_8_20_14_0_20_37_9]PIX94536.1 MAG: hypothetical protein COZ25_05085 [Ignavibacteria bacterium CG_4_10_14_3_um_filter_37_18]PJC60293.1 MAG: hypothetical protein CO025_03590 [Ignavibacteria bacterium CG_4_9_14_0_2_um_filter_37_13]